MIGDSLPKILARDVRPGDKLDLFGDPYADPQSDPANGLEFEYSLTESVAFEKGKRGSVDCVVLYGTGINVACPPDHAIPYGGRDPAWPVQTWQEARADLPEGYCHTAGNRFAKLRERGRGMDLAEIRQNAEGDHWIVYIR
jgi:hypothetical protein